MIVLELFDDESGHLDFCKGFVGEDFGVLTDAGVGFFLE